MVWQARFAAELGNLRGALDWYIERGDATSALSLTTGLAWVWFQRSDFHNAARWLDDALRITGDAPATLRAAAMGWRGYFNAWITGGQTAAIAEVSQGGRGPARRIRSRTAGRCVAEPRRAAQPQRRSRHDARSCWPRRTSVLTALDDRWGLAVHDFFTAGHLAPMGDLDGAEASARASVEAFGALGEQFLVFDSLGMLAGVAEARGDLEGAVATYEELLERARQGDLVNHIPLWLIRLGALRARLDDDATAEQLFSEAVARSDGPTMRGTALVGLAGATRRLGDVAVRPRHAWTRPRRSTGRSATTTVGWPCSPHRCWLAIAAGDLEAAADFADQACQGASHDDPSMRVSAQTAAAAVAAVGSGSEDDIERFAALVRQRNGQRSPGVSPPSSVGAVGSTLDEPDVAAMCRTLGLESSPADPHPPTCLLQIARGRDLKQTERGTQRGLRARSAGRRMLMTSQQRQPRTPNVSQSNERPPNPAASPTRRAPPVGDDHGRPLTTNATAAAWYRAAQGSVVNGDGPDPALRRALQADPTFAVAACDLLGAHRRSAPERAGASVDVVGASPLRDRQRGPPRRRARVRHPARAPRRRRLRPARRAHRVRGPPNRRPQRGSRRRGRGSAGVDGRLPSVTAK